MYKERLQEPTKAVSREDEFAKSVVSSMENEFDDFIKVDVLRQIKAELIRKIEMRMEENTMMIQKDREIIDALKDL